jgi:hypothetical protein
MSNVIAMFLFLARALMRGFHSPENIPNGKYSKWQIFRGLNASRGHTG